MNTIRCTLLAAITLCTIPTVSYADPIVLTLETMMEAQAHNSLYIGHLFGADPSTVLRFTSNLDPVARTFSFSLVPGQLYLGQSISLTTVGIFNSSLGQYNWTISGLFGSQSFSGNGSATWVGDPTGTVNTMVMLGGNMFQVMGTVEIESTPLMNRSSGTYTFTGPPGGPFAGPFGPYQGTDIFLEGRWQHTVEVPSNPIVPTGQVIFSSGIVPVAQGGPGNFEVQITPVPEPMTLLLLGTGLTGVAMKLRKRRRNGKNRAT